MLASKTWAQIPGQSGAATVYEITVSQVEICTDSSCSSSFVLGNTTATFDLASVSAGQDVGEFATASGIPAGVAHSHVRVTLNRAITITGSVSITGLASPNECTTRTGNSQGDTNTLGLGTTGSSSTATSQSLFVPGEGVTFGRGSDDASTGTSITSGTFSGTFNIDNVTSTTMTVTYPLGQTYTKQADDPDPRIEIKFNTSTALGAANTDSATTSGETCSLFPRPPDVIINISTP